MIDGGARPVRLERALTVCQPYAELLARGLKTIENRTWPSPVLGPLWIHAGKSREWLAPEDIADYPHMVFGALVARVELYACIRVEQLPDRLKDNPHANGPWCWLVRNPYALERPRPVRGAQGIWTLPADLAADVRGEFDAREDARRVPA